ncbi:MAG TPA: hypothetical protein VMB20_06995 [Candidatus Acidoferrum sp.]|nr:hypothetical protein [Candidatus Acidoferrum sp.]
MKQYLCGAIAMVALLTTQSVALARLPYDLYIVNPLPNPVWVTVYANGHIQNAFMVRPNYRWHWDSAQGNMKIMAEIKTLDGARNVCKTDMAVPKNSGDVTIHLNTSNNKCWWSR